MNARYLSTSKYDGNNETQLTLSLCYKKVILLKLYSVSLRVDGEVFVFGFPVETAVMDIALHEREFFLRSRSKSSNDEMFSIS